MKEIKYIMTTMTDNSLIIIDELCRSTSLEEGTALAIAIVEKLAQSSAFIYITTHYTMLTKLYDMYLNVKVWQLETIPSGEDPKTFNLDFKYNLVPGITSVKHYGVYIVRNIWPDSILQNVYELLNKITKKYENPKFTPLDEKVRLKYAVEAQFRKLKSQKKLTIAEINKILNQYQDGLQRLGCSMNQSINATPVDNPYNFQESLPQIRHSVFDNSQTVESFNDSNENVRSMDERMRTIFTPDSSLFLEHGTGVEAQRTEGEIKDIFTPESEHQSRQPLPVNPYSESYGNNEEAFYDNSNYKSIYPESGSSLSQSSSNIAQNVFGLFGTDFLKPTNETDARNNTTSFQNFFSNPQHSSSIDLSQDMNQLRFSEPLCNEAFKTSTPVPHQENFEQVYSQGPNFSTPSFASRLPITKIIDSAQSKILNEIDMESIREDLEIWSKTFDHDDFEESVLSDINKPPLENQRSVVEEKEAVMKKIFYPHIIPKVIINEGPNNTTLSFDGNDSISETNENRIKVISNILISEYYPVPDQRPENNYKEVENFPLDRAKGKSLDATQNDDKTYTNGKMAIGTEEESNNTNSEDNDDIQNENYKDVSYKGALEEQQANNLTSQRSTISDDEESKPGENLDSSNKVDKTAMTSISNASKLRNLEQATSESSPQEDSSAKKTSTSISSVSRKRNLDQVTTESSPSNELDKNSANKSGTTSSMKESDDSGRRIKTKLSGNVENVEDTGQENKKRRKLVQRNKFVPPRKLSAKEIREEFKEQDRKLLESSPSSSNFSKYLKQFVQRPSVKQVQNTTHLAYITRTDEGFEVIPAAPAKRRKKKSPIKRHYSNETFNLSIFSDKNAQPFENYLNSNEKDYKTFSFNFLKNQEVASHEDKFEFQPTTKSFGEYTCNSVTTRFVRKNSDTSISLSEANFGQNSVKMMTTRQTSEMSEAVGCGLTQQSLKTMTPDGFYKQNKEDMTRIVNKYLSGQQATGPDTHRNLSKLRSIFENEDIDVSDLDI